MALGPREAQLRAMRERRFAAMQASQRETVNKASPVNKTVQAIQSEVDQIASHKGNAAHQTKWRAANTELNRQRAREGMRKRRATAKETTE